MRTRYRYAHVVPIYAFYTAVCSVQILLRRSGRLLLAWYSGPDIAYVPKLAKRRYFVSNQIGRVLALSKTDGHSV